MPGFMAPVWIQLGLAWEIGRAWSQQGWGDAVEGKRGLVHSFSKGKGDSFIAFGYLETALTHDFSYSKLL